MIFEPWLTNVFAGLREGKMMQQQSMDLFGEKDEMKDMGMLIKVHQHTARCSRGNCPYQSGGLMPVLEAGGQKQQQQHQGMDRAGSPPLGMSAKKENLLPTSPNRPTHLGGGIWQSLNVEKVTLHKPCNRPNCAYCSR